MVKSRLTMVTKIKRGRTIPAGEFKARCLALLDRVARTRESIVVTKRGRPVARLAPLESDGVPARGLATVGGDPFVRARAAAGAFADPHGVRDVAVAHDRHLATIWGRG